MKIPLWAGLLLACWASTASAAVVLSVDLDPLTAGIQSDATLSANSTLTADFVLELTENTSIDLYSFSVRFDTSELQLQSRSESPGNIAGWTEVNGGSAGSAAGLLFNFDAFGPALTAPQGPFVVGSASFIATNPTGTAGELDIEVGPFNPNAGFDGFSFNATLLPPDQLDFRAASVSAVPEPSGIFMTIFATCGLLARRRKT